MWIQKLCTSLLRAKHVETIQSSFIQEGIETSFAGYNLAKLLSPIISFNGLNKLPFLQIFVQFSSFLSTARICCLFTCRKAWFHTGKAKTVTILEAQARTEVFVIPRPCPASAVAFMLAKQGTRGSCKEASRKIFAQLSFFLMSNLNWMERFILSFSQKSWVLSTGSDPGRRGEGEVCIIGSWKTFKD